MNKTYKSISQMHNVKLILIVKILNQYMKINKQWVLLIDIKKEDNKEKK